MVVVCKYCGYTYHDRSYCPICGYPSGDWKFTNNYVKCSNRKDAMRLRKMWLLSVLLLVCGTCFSPYVCYSNALLDQCVQKCADLYPVITSKVFPDNLTFEDTTSAGTGAYKGTSAVLFPVKWEGKILAVSMNGEKALHGVSYKGRPVFRFVKVGTAYQRPLKFVIETTVGDYIYTIGSTSDNTTPTTGFTHSAIYTSYGVRNGRQAWRITKRGDTFGKRIRITWLPSGKVMTVNDTSKNCRDRSDTCQRDSKGEVYGAVYKPGIGFNGDGDSNTGTSHGGVYLQGPWKNNDKTVKIEW